MFLYRDVEIKEDIVHELIDNKNDFDKLDNILKNLDFPKEITKIIFEYIKPCKLCSECCSLCKFYCYDSCLRYSNEMDTIRDFCCYYQYRGIINRYDNSKKND